MGFLDKVFKKKEKTGKKQPKGFELLRVKDIKRETPQAVQITFDVPSDLKSKFSFQPGQYINVALPINGKEERRSYSICSMPGQGDFSIAVKEIEQGTVSKHFNTDLKVGDEVYVSAPEGGFILDEKDGVYVGVAAGSGITPVMSMVETIAAKRPKSKFVLIYGNGTKEDVIFGARLEELEQKDNIDVVHFRSQEDAEGTFKGRITDESLQEYLKNAMPLLQSNAFYLCGPEEMILNAKKAIETFGVKAEKIKYELFTTPVSDAFSSKSKTASADSFSGNAHVKVILDDQEVEFDLATKGSSILEAAMDQGMDAPYSCQGGVCCTCKAKVLEGRIKMDQNFSLTDSEVEEGYVLTCQSHPVSENVVVSYDE